MYEQDCVTTAGCKPNVAAGSSHLNKENEVLEGGVEVGLLLQLHHRVKMLVVDVSVNPEQTLQDGFGHRHEVLRKRNSCGTAGGRRSRRQEDFVLFQSLLSSYITVRRQFNKNVIRLAA